MIKQEQMYRLIERHRTSGQTIKAFCEREGIKLHTFYYWRQKIKKQRSSSFIPINTSSRDLGKHSIELVYPNRVKIRLKRFDLEQIQQLIQLG